MNRLQQAQLSGWSRIIAETYPVIGNKIAQRAKDNLRTKMVKERARSAKMTYTRRKVS